MKSVTAKATMLICDLWWQQQHLKEDVVVAVAFCQLALSIIP